jgi:hypothetical protein
VKDKEELLNVTIVTKKVILQNNALKVFLLLTQLKRKKLNLNVIIAINMATSLEIVNNVELQINF